MNTVRVLFAAMLLACTVAMCGCSDSIPEPSGEILISNPAPPYMAMEIKPLSAAGQPHSYEELHDFIYRYSDAMNFYKYEIVSVYTAEEAFELTGEDIYLHSTTLYDIHITYDCLNGVPLDIFTRLAAAGTTKSQMENRPLYMVGEVYASFLIGFNAGYDNVALPELVFAIEQTDGAEYAYHLNFANIALIDGDGLSIADDTFSPASVITSTSNNPVRYVSRFYLPDLADYLRDDWLSRGYTLI